jgi:uncharacterized repeat protein (TIGR03803 family)
MACALALLGAAPARAQITVLTNFTSETLAESPRSGVVTDGTMLYGTTFSGGTNGYGTIYSVPIAGGAPTVLYNFDSTTYGANPMGSLTLDNGTLYGTAGGGGANGDGTVFSLPVTGGTPTLLATFNGTNGKFPYTYSGLVVSGGMLYGTTNIGGANNDGTVFSVPVTGGTLTTLYSFDNAGHGYNPYGGLTLVDGTLYGTAVSGGPAGHGTVFSLPITGGTPTVLASFSGGVNGANPEGGLTVVGGTLYGTTQRGGTSNFGTVFSLPIGGGTPTILANFSSSAGTNPVSTLATDGTNLFGTAYSGGSGNYGTVFSLPINGGTGTPTVLGAFNTTNGRLPTGNLTLLNGTLYGTAQGGGSELYGTIYSLPAPVPEPGSVALLLGGIFAVGMGRRRRG